MADFDAITLAQFWGRVTVTDAASCWEWRGPETRGYGRFRGERTHRLAYQLINGAIPDGLMVLHSCDNRRCCNPAHLRAGTHADNVQDAIDRRRFARGSANGNTKLTDEQIRYIRSNPDKKTGAALARQFGIAESTISYIRRNMRRNAA